MSSSAPRPPASRLPVTIAVMTATIMQVLDTTIVNVALPHMMGELSATASTISWVLTSYLASSAIMMPMTGYFTDTLGRRRYLLICIAGFVVASGLCGMAWSLAAMVVFRLLQGVFGAALVPLSQAVMIETFSVEERQKAMAIWGMGVMIAPIMGPTLGGWLTEAMSWRWTFFINLPVGALSLLLAWRYIRPTPTRERRMDWTGFAALAVAIAALQLLLDKGNEEDWLASPLIVWSTVVSVAGFAFFLWHGLATQRERLFDLAIFADRNFTAACIVIAVIGVGLFGGQLLLPQFYETWLGFPVAASGLFMIPRGVGTFASMTIVSRLSGRLQPKRAILTGIALSVVGSYLMTRLSSDVTGWTMAGPLALQGLGMGLVFAPMSALAFSTLPVAKAREAAGVFSLVRSIGASIGVSVVATYFSRSAQAHWELMRAYVTPYRQAVPDYLANLHASPTSPLGIAVLAQEVARQSQLAAFVDSFWFIAASFVVTLPVVLLMRGGRPAVRGGAHAVAE